jgi:hypothetical protein
MKKQMKSNYLSPAITPLRVVLEGEIAIQCSPAIRKEVWEDDPNPTVGATQDVELFW